MLPSKTKIVCTIGPSSSSEENLVKLIDAGMDVARLNFSHATKDVHLEVIQNVRNAAKTTNKPIAILQDLQGPKIRIGKMPEGGVMLIDGNEFTISADYEDLGSEKICGLTYKNLVSEVKAGNALLLDDGYIILEIVSVKKNEIHTKIKKGGLLKSSKGIIAPGVPSNAPSLSEKDIEDLKFGLQSGVDMVALSFVRSERDVIELKTAMKIFGRIVPIISKIERVEAVESIEGIINESYGIMVARGDLGLEMPAELVPCIQKELISKSRYYGKPVITATQMLESMISNPRPTRAEASDVANAVLDGTDCVMLSGETSVGKYPVEAVEYMDKIIRAIEHKNDKFELSKHIEPKNEYDNISDALSKASCVLAEQIHAKAIITLTNSGYTARNIGKYRPKTPIIALTSSFETYNLLALHNGIESIYIKQIPSEFDDLFCMEELKKIEFIQENDYVVFVSGLSDSTLMDENKLKVLKV